MKVTVIPDEFPEPDSPIEIVYRSRDDWRRARQRSGMLVEAGDGQGHATMAWKCWRGGTQRGDFAEVADVETLEEFKAAVNERLEHAHACLSQLPPGDLRKPETYYGVTSIDLHPAASTSGHRRAFLRRGTDNTVMVTGHKLVVE